MHANPHELLVPSAAMQQPGIACAALDVVLDAQRELRHYRLPSCGPVLHMAWQWHQQWHGNGTSCLPQVLRVVSLGMVAVSASFSPDGQHLAVGLQCGGIKVLSFWPSTAQVWWGRPSKESVDVLSYSPDGRWLAAGRQL